MREPKNEIKIKFNLGVNKDKELIKLHQMHDGIINQYTEQVVNCQDKAVKQGLKDLGYTKDNMSMLFNNIDDWGEERGLLDPKCIDKQLHKAQEELGEIAGGHVRGNLDKVKDGIGDMVVVMYLLARQHGWTFKECVEYAFNQIKNRKGKLVDGCYIKNEDLP